MANITVDTLLEFYDRREPIVNVAGAWHVQPRRIVYFHYGLKDEAAERKKLAQMFERIGLRISVSMVQLERRDVRDMMEWVQAHQAELGEFAIDLTGGDDIMLFTAGCCYEHFPCRLFSGRPDGRYVMLPSGEILAPGRGEFSVEQRLLLNNAVLERFGRLTQRDLTPQLLNLADRMLTLQRNHSRQWTGVTRCIQQCVSRAPDDALTVLLDHDTCRQNKVNAGKGSLLRSFVRAGALKSVKETGEGIVITFPDMTIRDCLCDYGVWLEIAVYDAVKSSGAFDDVQISCVVQWDNEKIINELDVVATAGMGLILISCKTCAPDMEALAELNVLGDRLGSARTMTALVSLPKGTERLDNRHARCEELGVRLIDLRQHTRQSLSTAFAQLGQQLPAGRLR